MGPTGAVRCGAVFRFTVEPSFDFVLAKREGNSRWAHHLAFWAPLPLSQAVCSSGISPNKIGCVWHYNIASRGDLVARIIGGQTLFIYIIYLSYLFILFPRNILLGTGIFLMVEKVMAIMFPGDPNWIFFFLFFFFLICETFQIWLSIEIQFR